MKNRTRKRWRPFRVQTSIVKKSAAASRVQCLVRNSFHVVLRIRSGAGSTALRFRILAIVLRASWWPRFDSAPRIRRYPQSLFSMAIRTTSASSSFPVAGRPGVRRALTVVLVRDELPVPVQQSLGSRNGGHLRQQPSSEQFCLCCQAAALVVGEAKAAVAELSPKHAVLFAQVLDSMLLMLIHPARDRYQHKAKRVQRLRHRFSRLPSRAGVYYGFATHADPVSGYYDSDLPPYPDRERPRHIWNAVYSTAILVGGYSFPSLP